MADEAPMNASCTGHPAAVPAGASSHTAAWLLDGRPRWEAIEAEILCSRCDYDLRMLEEPRCPECGLAFEWSDVVDRASRHNPFLFEHNWRKQPVRLWLETVVRGLRPGRFWQRVSLHDTTRCGPLWFLLLTAPLWFLATLAGALYAGSILGFLLSHWVYATPLPDNLWFGWVRGATGAPLYDLATRMRGGLYNFVSVRRTASGVDP